MSAPTFISENETVYNTGSPKSVTVTVLARDVLVVYAITQDAAETVAISNNGAALAWTQHQVILVTAFCWLSVWTNVLEANRAGMLVTLTRTGGTGDWGGNAVIFRESDGTGVSAKTTAASGAPTLNLTTTRDHSAILVVTADWSSVDGASRVWRTGAGALSETTYHRTAGQLTAYGGFHPNVGLVGTYTVGVTAPTGQKYSIAALEILGSTPPIDYGKAWMRFRA